VTDPIAVDTSVAVPLLVRPHPAHEVSRRWRKDRDLVLAGHAAVETYSVLTRLPGDLAVDAGTAHQLITHLFVATVTMAPGAQEGVTAELAAAGVAGGAVYDGLVALAAREHGLPLATRDVRARSTYERLGARVVAVG
jgi:predicted nucleic acid-binding protein